MFREKKQIDIDGLKKQSDSQDKKIADFEAKQNAMGFFSLLLKVAKRNPELWKEIYNENNANNRNTNNTN